MLKIGQNWGKIANYHPQCSTKIGTTAWAVTFRSIAQRSTTKLLPRLISAFNLN